MPFTQAAGASLYWKRDGRDDAPALVLLNSIGTDMDLWDAVLPFLAEGRQVVLDLHDGAVRAHWHARFVEPLEALQQRLGARRIQVHVISTDDASDCWLGPQPSAVVA